MKILHAIIEHAVTHALKRALQGIFTAGVLGTAVISSSCNYAGIDDTAAPTTTPEKVSPYQLQLTAEIDPFVNGLAFHPFQTWLSLSYAPSEVVTDIEDIDSNFPSENAGVDPLKVKPSRTPWAPAWDRESVVLVMNDILAKHNVSSLNTRVRMIAHAIVASGWKQNVWNFNAWGVRQGSWEKSWYEMPTYEEDESGHYVFVDDASWRAFSSWDEAIDDFQQRISADSERPSYREAHRHLVTESVSFRVAKAYWEALGDGNYYTASNFTGEKFARLCGGVRSILKSHPSL